MRIVHTSDWHLGHRLHGFDRSAEHAHFLTWLIDQLETLAADALLIAGDIFDTANPPASALTQWYDFLAQVARRCPGLHIVAIGGNHDSAARLDAPAPLLRALSIDVRGGRIRRGDAIPVEEFIVEVRGRVSNQRIWLAALPFLRPCDLPAVADANPQDAIASGIKALYDAAFAAIDQRRAAQECVVALGHLYLRGAAPSEWSERQILGGNQHAIPASVFHPGFNYVALGHLHRAQKIERESIRYSGSPLPLALDERDYRHQILVVDLQAGEEPTIAAVATPRLLALPRIPSHGSAELKTILEMLHDLSILPPTPGLPPRGAQALLELAVEINQPTPGLRAQVEQAIKDKNYQVARLSIHAKDASGAVLAEQSDVILERLTPHEVLGYLWQRNYGREVPAREQKAFAELLDAVHQGSKT